MLDLVLVDGEARGIVARDLVTGEIEAHAADAVVLATGGYCNVYYLSTNAKNCNATAIWRAHKRGAGFANPCFTQIHPTCIPQSGDYQSKLTLMSESLRNDGRIWVPQGPRRGARARRTSPTRTASTTSRSATRATATSCRATSPPGRRRSSATRGSGVGSTGRGVYLDFRDAIESKGAETIAGRYGNLFAMYERITGDSPWETPMKIYPAPHYSMGGLWVDYGLQTTIPGLFAIGEANFSDHGANRLGASAMMQCLADGYFILPHTVTDYLAGHDEDRDPDNPAYGEAVDARARAPRRADVGRRRDRAERLPPPPRPRDARQVRDHPRRRRACARRSTTSARSATSSGATCGSAAAARSSTRASSTPAGVADFFELAELMCRDAIERDESCGCHLREEHQTDEGEAVRDDDHFAGVQVWEHTGDGRGAGAARRGARVRGRRADARGATSELHAERLAPAERGRGGRLRAPRGRATSTARPRSSRCSTSSTSGSSTTAAPRSPTTATAWRGSAAPATC